jgi:hypothetical protein
LGNVLLGLIFGGYFLSKNTHLTKTLLFTFSLSIATSSIAFIIQSNANRSVTSCSYLDPITIDICALVFAAFLILEGLWDIYRHKRSFLKSQLTRSIRVSMGFAILTTHILQFIHK